MRLIFEQVSPSVVVIRASGQVVHAMSYSLSAGWISARWAPNTVYKSMPLAEFLQTNATINTGNSGGPMFNLAGEVIGLVSHNISKSGGSEGLGFVVTINTAKQLLLEKKSFWGGLAGGPLGPSRRDDVRDDRWRGGRARGRHRARRRRRPGGLPGKHGQDQGCGALKITILRAGRVLDLTVKVP